MPSETAADLTARKAALRPEAQQRRAAAAAANPEAGAELRDTFLRSIALPAGAAVSGYWPSRTELDLRPLLTALAGRGHAVGLPVVVEKAAPLLFRRWRPGDALELGAFRIEIPSADQPEVVPQVLLVPLLAFDRNGYRLGYGGGFYDRTLEKLRRSAPGGGPPLAVGVAFAGQEVEAVPRDHLDARLDWIVTEREALRFGQTPREALRFGQTPREALRFAHTLKILHAMRILFCGDIVGRPGRDALAAHLPGLRRDLALDLVIANGENAASGFGISESVCKQILGAGVDVITGGNHSWDQREALAFIDREPRLLRPHNFPTGTPGRGAALVDAGQGRKVLVLNVMGRLFMDPLDDPFATVERELAKHRLGSTVQAIVVDFHAEATSEKMAMGHFLDGRVSLCVGTHTHVPTADDMILPGGTAYQSDAGMCGNYDSVIGMDKVAPVARFTRKLPTERLSVAAGEGTLCAVFVETDPKSGLARQISPLRVGGLLRPIRPQVESTKQKAGLKEPAS